MPIIKLMEDDVYFVAPDIHGPESPWGQQPSRQALEFYHRIIGGDESASQELRTLAEAAENFDTPTDV